MGETWDAEAYWRQAMAAAALVPATKFVGFELIEFSIDDGWCDARFLLPPEAANPAGNAQGGMVSVMLDEVMSLAASIVQDGPAMAPTLQMTTSYIRPVPVGAPLIGRGEVVRRGRAAIFTEGRLTDESGKLLATATASCIPRLISEIT